MLHLILGRAGTGKTYTVFERIKNDVENGKQVVLLVPEQFTFESERTLLHKLGDKASTNAQVLSFTRLYDEVSRKVGGRVADIINDGDRAILMGQALKASQLNLKLWGKYINSPKFSNAVLATVNELKAAAVTPEKLHEIADEVKSDYFKAKLNDVAAVYAAYNALLGERFLDPNDNLDRLSESLLEYRFFENKTVYIDAFKNFTGQQYKIIDKLISQCDDATFSFTAPDLDYDKFDIFQYVRKTAENLYKIAQNHRVDISKPVILNEFHFNNKSLCKIEALFSDSLCDTNDDLQGVTLCKCNTVYDEAEFAARTIRKAVRKEGYRYRDFVIIARDAEKYKNAVETACRKNDVYCFSDRRKSINDMPLPLLISAYLKLTNSYKTENILEILHCGIFPLNDDEIYELENYVYIWNINGQEWAKPWNMNPKGFEAVNEKVVSENENKLEKLNSYRIKITESIEKFRRSFRGTPSQMAEAIVNLLDSLNASETLKTIYSENYGGTLLESDAIQCYDAVMEVLDGIVKCLPDKETTVKEFSDNWNVAVKSVTIGNIPQMLDEVTFGSADRIKPSSPKIAFILGAYQNEFPKLVSNTGVFAADEREILKEKGASMIETNLSAAIDEDYLVYTSLCCATDRIYITYPTFALGESGVEPSSIVNLLSNTFPKSSIKAKEPDTTLNYDNSPETVKSAVARMCGTYSFDKSAGLTIEKALKKTAGITLNDYLASADKRTAGISPQNSEKIFTKRINVSATKFEKYHECKFLFFCKYGLNIKKLSKADINALQRGTLIHYIMENLIKDYGKDIASFDKSKIDELVEGYIADYLSEIGGIEEFLDSRMKFLISKISEFAKKLAFHIASEFAQSDFTPDFCELKIGRDGIVPSKKVVCENGTEMRIEGSIDRVDTWNGYIRVVDYKTGKKTFKLSDTLVGLNLQMLIYLYSLVRSNNDDFNKLSTAGVLYVPNSEDKNNGFAMNGIIVDQENIYTAMEKENEGKFIPKFETTKSGAVKGNTYVSGSVFETIFDYIEKLLNGMASEIEKGNMSAIPTDGQADPCKNCEYYPICCIENNEHIKAENLKNHEALEKMREVLQ